MARFMRQAEAQYAEWPLVARILELIRELEAEGLL